MRGRKGEVIKRKGGGGGGGERKGDKRGRGEERTIKRRMVKVEDGDGEERNDKERRGNEEDE